MHKSKSPVSRPKTLTPKKISSYLWDVFRTERYQTLPPDEKQRVINDAAKELNSMPLEAEQRAKWDINAITKRFTKLGIKMKKEAEACNMVYNEIGIASTGGSLLCRLLAMKQAEMVFASRAARVRLLHTGDKGTAVELIVVEMLESMVCTSLVGIGCGEVLLSTDANHSGQNDIVLFDTRIPSLTGGKYFGPTLFFKEGVVAMVEVKTVLDNRDIIDQIGPAASKLYPIPVFVIGFESGCTLDSLEVQALGPNVQGLFIFNRGSIVQTQPNIWRKLSTEQYCPLAAFFAIMTHTISNHKHVEPFNILHYMPQLPC